MARSTRPSNRSNRSSPSRRTEKQNNNNNDAVIPVQATAPTPMDELIEAINNDHMSNQPPPSNRGNSQRRRSNSNRNNNNNNNNNNNRNRTNNNRRNQQSIFDSMTMQDIALNGLNPTTPTNTTDDRHLLPAPIDNIAELRALTNRCADSLMRKNTRDAYKYKMLEFRAFCHVVYPHEQVEVRYAVDSDKLYRFLFYQVFRDRKRTKHLKPGEFDFNLYTEVDQKYKVLLRENNGQKRTAAEILTEMEPKNPLGYSSINTYRAAVRKLYDYQRHRSDGTIAPCKWDSEIMNPSNRKLFSLVEVSANPIPT